MKRDIADYVGSLPGREREALDRLLIPGEQVLWATRPLARARRVHCYRCAGFAFFFTLVSWVGLSDITRAYCGEYQVFEWMMAGIALWLLLSFLSGRQLYIITGRRVLILDEGLFGIRACSHELDRNMVIRRDDGLGGSGSLIFEYWSLRDFLLSRRRDFLHLPNVQEAVDALDAAFDGQQNNPS